MPTAQTLYRTHHEHAKQASRRLSFIFWLGVILSALSYILVARLALHLLLATDLFFSIFILPFNPWIISTILGVIPIISMIKAYFSERRRMKKTKAQDLAIKMGAEPLRLNGDINQQRLKNIVEEIAVASGIKPPPILSMEKDHSINAFVIGGAEHSVALTVSHGAIKHLTRDELQALVAHEFGHIINQDVFIYSKLSAMLYGYYIISEWRYGQQSISSSRLSFLHFSRNEDGIDVYYYLIGFWGFILLGCGRLIQAGFSREREWMADAKSVEYTRNSSALVSVLKKALALQYLHAHTPKNPESVAHFFFINYQPKTNFLNMQTHPPIKERIKRYGNNVSKDEIAALAYEMQEKQKNSVLDNVETKYQKAFTTAITYPILIVKKHTLEAQNNKNNTKKINANMLVYAAFIFHSGQTWFELSQSKKMNQSYLIQAKNYLTLITKIHPIEQFYYYEHYCQLLRFKDSEDKKEFITSIKQLIILDKDFSIYEWCYWLLLQQALRPIKSENEHYKNLQNELKRVFSFCVCVFSEDSEKRKQLFHYLIQQGIPVSVKDYIETTATTNTFISLQKDIIALQKLKPIYKKQIISGLENAFATIKSQNLTGIYIKNTLKSLLIK